MKSLWVFTLILTLMLFTFTGCVTTSKQPPEGAKLVKFNLPEIGSKYKWKSVNFGEEKITNSVFSKEEIDGRLLYFWNDDSDTSHMYETEALNWVGLWSFKNKHWLKTAKPSNKRFQYPLWVGKKYRASYQFSERGGWSGRLDTWVHVEKWETLTLPSGTFKTLKVIQKNKYFKSINWLAPELGSSVKFKMKNKKGIKRGELLKFVEP